MRAKFAFLPNPPKKLKYFERAGKNLPLWKGKKFYDCNSFYFLYNIFTQRIVIGGNRMSEKWTLVWSPLKKLSEESLLLVPTSAGVYRLSYLANDQKIYVFYAGKTDNLQQRLREHLSRQDDNVCIGRMINDAICYFRYAIVNDENVRNGAERALYLHYKPQCNSQEPSGSDIEINFD